MFTGPTGMEKRKCYVIIGSYGTIHIFKTYFTIVFSIFSFQFSIISDIQTDPNLERNILVGP